jgi:6-pyruvoyltetrahydropterin/6-carboxytetrahydropterin synthase
MIITRRYELDMGHCLPDHEGKCHRPHGHRYRVEASVQGVTVMRRNDPERGMVTDFANVKAAMATVLDEYDHRFVMFEDDPRLAAVSTAFGADDLVVVPLPPTAEMLAVLWAEQLRTQLFGLTRLRVYETPNCWADWCA